MTFAGDLVAFSFCESVCVAYPVCLVCIVNSNKTSMCCFNLQLVSWLFVNLLFVFFFRVLSWWFDLNSLHPLFVNWLTVGGSGSVCRLWLVSSPSPDRPIHQRTFAACRHVHRGRPLLLVHETSSCRETGPAHLKPSMETSQNQEAEENSYLWWGLRTLQWRCL